MAARFAEDAVARDRAGAAPFAEIALLRESGLLGLLVPADRGGAGAPWAAAFDVTRRVTRADASLGHLLGYHYLQSWRTRLVGPDGPGTIVDRLDRETAAGPLFWGGAGNPRDAALVLDPGPDGELRVTGRKHFATGAQVADRIIASGTRSDTGRKLAIVLDAAHPGVSHGDDWDSMGQRASASGSVAFDAVPVTVLGPGGEDAGPRASLAPLGFQLVLCHLHVGTAEGALAAAAEYTRTTTRPWPASGVASAVEDPYLLRGYGELASDLLAAAALTDVASARYVACADAGDALDSAARGDAAVAISAAKVVTTRVALDVTSRVFELTGARAAGGRYGFDRFWRNVRTLTLHDPVDHKAREVGAHALTGAWPEPSGYS